MMKNVKRKLRVKFNPLILLVGFTLSPFAFAEEPISIAVSVGKSQTDVQQSHVDITHVDDNDSSWAAEFAYHFDQFAITIGYVDLGEASVELNADSYDPAAYHEQVKAVSPVLIDGVTIGVEVPFYQHEKYTLKGQVGLLVWDNEIVSIIDTGNKLTTSTSGTDAYLGVSADYEFSKNWMLGLQYRGYMLDESINDIAVKLSYQF